MKHKILRLISKLQQEKEFAMAEMKKRNSNYSQQWCIVRIETLDMCIKNLSEIIEQNRIRTQR